MVVPLKANEVVIKAGDSSYLDDAEKICGKLIITNQRIYFVTSNGHAEKYDQVFPIYQSLYQSIKPEFKKLFGLNR